MGVIFKKYFNLTPQDFLINFRIEKACSLMQNPELTIGDISRSVGYNDQMLFSRVFKKIKGIPPSRYREKINKLA
jgi:AraC-like DNA-binding protein